MRWQRVLVMIFFGWAGFISVGFAAVSLSVNALDGSDSLSKEIQIRVVSNRPQQYQVFQRVVEPTDLKAIDVQALSYSNSSGTLRDQDHSHLSLADRLLYTSGRDGEDDSFIVRYSLDPDFVNIGGKFTGKIVFSLRLMDRPVSQQVKFYISFENPSALKVSVQGGYDPKRVRIRDSDISVKTADFAKISFSGNRGRQVRVYQELEVPLKNEMGHPISTNVLRANGRPLKNGKELIYSGSKDEDDILIYFLVDPNKIDEQDAGTYTGKIKYVLETNKVQREFILDIQCTVQPVFSMDVSAPSGGVVTVMVTTNLHKHYQVVQNFQKIEVNKNGKEFDAKHFLMKVDIPSYEQGHTDFTDFVPVKKGEYPVFSSDAQGSPTEFKVVYHLEGYDKMSMGNFLAPVKFSLNQK